MQRSIICAALAVALFSSSIAQTQEAPRSSYSGGTRQSVLSGQTLGEGATSFHGQVGWPGLAFSLLHGVAPKVDFGGKLSLLYGYEGITRVDPLPGVKMQGVVKLNLLERGKLNFGLRFSPGLFFYFFDGYTQPGLTLPIDVVLGIAVAPNLMINVGIDFPIFVAFGEFSGLVVPVLAGGGLEYFLDRNLGITFNVRAGPSALVTDDYPSYYVCEDALGRPYRCGRRTLTAAEFLVGISYKF